MNKAEKIITLKRKKGKPQIEANAFLEAFTSNVTETLELRINFEYAHLLFSEVEGKNYGTTIKIIELNKEDPRYSKVPIIDKDLKRKFDQRFFFGWRFIRKYSKKEMDEARLLHLKIKSVFGPTGEECGTKYDYVSACEFCGANVKQINSLQLRNGTIPKKDISKTFGGEIVVSEKFVRATIKWDLRGLNLISTNIGGFYQLTTETEINLSTNTIVGINPFDLSNYSEDEIYKCPKNHTLGLNLLSVPYVLYNQQIEKFDFLKSKQLIGVQRGLLHPEPVIFCSQRLRRMVIEEKLSGFDFEI